MTYRMSIALPEWSRDFLETYRAANGLRSLNAAVVRIMERELDRKTMSGGAFTEVALKVARQANSTKGEGE